MKLAILVTAACWAATIYLGVILCGCTRGFEFRVGATPITGIEHRQTFSEAEIDRIEEAQFRQGRGQS